MAGSDLHLVIVHLAAELSTSTFNYLLLSEPVYYTPAMPPTRISHGKTPHPAPAPWVRLRRAARRLPPLPSPPEPPTSDSKPSVHNLPVPVGTPAICKLAVQQGMVLQLYAQNARLAADMEEGLSALECVIDHLLSGWVTPCLAPLVKRLFHTLLHGWLCQPGVVNG